MFAKLQKKTSNTYQLKPTSSSISPSATGLRSAPFANFRYFASPLQRMPEPSEAKLAAPSQAAPSALAQAKDHVTGLPAQLKSGIENLSGMAMDQVKVHYNSPQAARYHALAYAQGSEIHIASGQEQYLPHEAWHVVQQAQGRVKPTMQMKGGVPGNDDIRLEREADVMGSRAMAAGGQSTLLPSPARLAEGARMPMQRAIEDIPLPEWILELPGFQAAYQHSERNSLADAAYNWAMEELQAMLQIIDVSSAPDLLDAMKPLFDRLGEMKYEIDYETASPQEVSEKFLPVAQTISRLTGLIFKLDGDKQMPFADGGERGKYGYHLTKLHNLPSIKASGLNPMMGASDRGSVAMSTGDQVKGSIQTSTGMVAFGDRPSTFRPYINQSEDRRQMLPGAPLEMKPVMLRFVIADTIGDRVLEGLDYMDGTALNTDSPIAAGMIEVLTAEGWRALSSWSQDLGIYPLRSQNDDVHLGEEWVGMPVILDFDTAQQVTNGMFEPLMELGSYVEQTAWLEANWGRSVENKKAKLTFTFRGATMQTSGNIGSWEYAFTVTGAGDTNWLTKSFVKYKKEYGDRADKHIQEYRNLL